MCVAQSSRKTDESRPDATEKHIRNYMTLNQCPGLLGESCKSCRRVSFWTSPQIFQKMMRFRGKTHLGTYKQTLLTYRPRNSSIQGNVSSQKQVMATAKAATPCSQVLTRRFFQTQNSDDTALEIRFEMKTGKHVFQKKTCRELYAFVTSAAKKGRKEVSERQMSLEERRKFDPAKQKEIKNYVVNDVLEKLELHEKPPRESILRMRWVLEYRLDENENKSPKAPIVILGYFDPDYENRPAASPTMTRNTRQLLLQFGASMGFPAAKGDVSGAFLQGRNLQRDLWVLPVPELAAALDVAPGEIMKLKKAAYGLVEAPVEWCISISTVLKEHAWRRLKSDSCGRCNWRKR